jgi:predicted Zn finger-like uncharacterized protein
MPKVFISHASQDREFVESEIIPLLRAQGIEAWYSRESIVPADQWERSILQGLRACDNFLLVMSPRSARSAWVKREVDWVFHKGGRTVVPMLMEDCDPDDFHIGLAGIQHVDFSKDREAGRRRLLQVWSRGEVESPPMQPSASTASLCLACPHCRTPLRVPASQPPGQKVKCPRCGIGFTPGGPAAERPSQPPAQPLRPPRRSATDEPSQTQGGPPKSERRAIRLTLRTLLAYSDDTLRPDEWDSIDEKVADSDAAQELMARIDRVIRVAPIPPATGPNARFDANIVAEYLDNELAADETVEVEKVCLESDGHLAEVADCHQILTLVLSQDAVVSPSARERMYEIGTGPKPRSW